MDRLWVIAGKEVRTRFLDRRLLLIMLAAPLAISTIIGLAFGGLGRSASPIRDIPVAVINQDVPPAGGTAFGAILASLLTTGQAASSACPQASSGNRSEAGGLTLGELIQGIAFEPPVAENLVSQGKILAPAASAGSPAYLAAAAREAVDKGVYAAVVIIPANFSASLASLAGARQAAPAATIRIYANGGQGVAAQIVGSVVNTIVTQLVSGNIATGATLGELAARRPQALAGASDPAVRQLFACAFAPGKDLVGLVEKPVQSTATSAAGAILVSFGSAQALFFALFTGQFGVLSMYDERRNWTLQRLLASPTPRWAILGGKLVGVVASVVVQLLALVLALTLVGSLIEGQPTFIWGTDFLRLGLVILGVSFAVSGLGMFLAGILNGVEQASLVGSVLNMALGILGGAFGFQLPPAVEAFSLIYWGRHAFEVLAAGQGNVSLNILVLFAEGAVLFALGLVLFNRKFAV